MLETEALSSDKRARGSQTLVSGPELGLLKKQVYSVQPKVPILRVGCRGDIYFSLHLLIRYCPPLLPPLSTSFPFGTLVWTEWRTSLLLCVFNRLDLKSRESCHLPALWLQVSQSLRLRILPWSGPLGLQGTDLWWGTTRDMSWQLLFLSNKGENCVTLM